MRLFPPRPRAIAANDAQLIPLINIIFLMLIFFMVAGRISAQKTAAPITLPEAALEQVATAVTAAGITCFQKALKPRLPPAIKA